MVPFPHRVYRPRNKAGRMASKSRASLWGRIIKIGGMKRTKPSRHKHMLLMAIIYIIMCRPITAGRFIMQRLNSQLRGVPASPLALSMKAFFVFFSTAECDALMMDHCTFFLCNTHNTMQGK